MPVLFVALPRKSPPRQGRGRRWGWWLGFLVALGLIVVGHGCHSGDHDVDDEPVVHFPLRDQADDAP